jgi:hypothetical protein
VSHLVLHKYYINTTWVSRGVELFFGRFFGSDRKPAIPGFWEALQVALKKSPVSEPETGEVDQLGCCSSPMQSWFAPSVLVELLETGRSPNN